MSVFAGQFAIERFAHAAIILLAFIVCLAVFIRHEALFALLGGSPVVAVVGVEVSFIETELRHEDGVARQLVEIVEELSGLLIEEEEDIEVALVVRESHRSRLFCAEIIAARLERVPHDAITRS